MEKPKKWLNLPIGLDHSTGSVWPYFEDQTIADAYGAERTPEIFAFGQDRKLRYHGRIDDNKDESLVQFHDLRNAINCILTETPIENPETTSIGCSIKWLT